MLGETFYSFSFLYRPEQEHEIKWTATPAHWSVRHVQAVCDKKSNICFYPSGERVKLAGKSLLS